MRSFDFSHHGNIDYIDDVYRQYQLDPASVDESWRAYFAGFETGLARSEGGSGMPLADNTGGMGVYDLVHTYRELGHFEANIDPLGADRPRQPLLDLAEFNMSDKDMDRLVSTGSFCGPTDGTLRDLIAKLRTTYCGNIGVEFMGISSKEQRDWLQNRMEPTLNQPQIPPARAREILFQLIAAEEFERFLHTRYVGKKRFSLEGGEAVIPLVNTLIDCGCPIGVENFVLGMAHRGRLNVLAHVLNKPYEVILGEFEGNAYFDESGSGDVKYHLGYSSTRPYHNGNKVKLSLQPNPSHLELVNPVVEGIVRAKQAYINDKDRVRVVPILIHGDAAFTGQGVVHETLCLSELPGYRTGGTLHVIINNQVGFTTLPSQGRFTPYPTDVAKNIQAPIFHVNGDDPEAVVHASQIAIEFREKFKCDVIIDLWCYRKHGHNETDEPTYTQPLMYQKISEKQSVRELYEQRVIERGAIKASEAADMKKIVIERLEAAMKSARESKIARRTPSFGGVWNGLGRAGADWSAKTSVPKDVLTKIAEATNKTPEGFTPHPKLARLYQSRRESVVTGKGIDWGTGEMLAMGSLLLEGTPIRFTGQDVERGTFSHRQAGLRDNKTGEQYIPLNHIDPDQPAQIHIMNSMLSELACLGFEWGFAAADPRNLVVWEAQFGDFVNGAQPIIDQFLAAAESKWQQSNGMVLFLPHGYEGQGPEHSNAYLERFLSLCGEDNMQIVVPSTPAQVFHAMRRQIHRRFRKPLISFNPKGMLRFEPSYSKLEDFTDLQFQNVMDDSGIVDRTKVRRLLLCTGKVYYSLAAARDKTAKSEVAIVRIEQLYPWPKKELQQLLMKYRSAEEICWVQEEPANRGAYSFVDRKIRDLLPPGQYLTYIGRPEAASPATGSEKTHKVEEADILAKALEVPSKRQELKDTAKALPATAQSGQAVSD
jgi:2-oxoglutarate dehydrogenase E1 component